VDVADGYVAVVAKSYGFVVATQEGTGLVFNFFHD
jgi:hypothetical protein